jgi:hypothetical protein
VRASVPPAVRYSESQRRCEGDGHDRHQQQQIEEEGDAIDPFDQLEHGMVIDQIMPMTRKLVM